MKGRCPDCDTLQSLSGTGKQIGTWGSATYKRVDAHKHPTKPLLCDGSGKLI